MKVEKVYTTKKTLCKNGVTKPITRVHKETPCDVCQQPMVIEKHIKGTQQKRAWIRWRCTDPDCNHSKVSEGEKDKLIRIGLRDKAEGILRPHVEV